MMSEGIPTPLLAIPAFPTTDAATARMVDTASYKAVRIYVFTAVDLETQLRAKGPATTDL